MPTAREVASGKKKPKKPVGGPIVSPKKPKIETKPKPKRGWKKKLMDAAVEMIPGGKKIEKAMKERTGGKKGKSMREKHYPKKK